MISTQEQWFVYFPTRGVKLLVADLGVELLVLDHVGLGIADVSEDLIVHVEAAVVHAGPLLALRAHADNRLEGFEFVHGNFILELENIL